MLHSISLAIAGAEHPNKSGPTRRFAIALCRPGDPVHLVPEPKNLKDPNAIQVMSAEGIVMGYVRAERAPWLGVLMRDARITGAIFQEATSYGAVIRIGLDGADPQLPPVREKPPQDDSGFWPDEVPPDE